MNTYETVGEYLHKKTLDADALIDHWWVVYTTRPEVSTMAELLATSGSHLTVALASHVTSCEDCSKTSPDVALLAAHKFAQQFRMLLDTLKQ